MRNIITPRNSTPLNNTMFKVWNTIILTTFLVFQLTASPDEWPAIAEEQQDIEWSLSFVSNDLQGANSFAVIACKPNVQVSLNQLGYAVVTPSMIVSGPIFPLNQYTIEIMGPLSDTVFCDQIGEEVMVVAEDPDGNTCMTSITVQDKLKPVLVCTGDTLKCNVDIDTIDFESFIDEISDNCDSDVDLFYTYAVTPLQCNPGNIVAFIKVNWTATDDYGNSTTCSDTIFLERPPIDSIVFPLDTIISCVDGDPDPEVLGGPTLCGDPIDVSCKYIAWNDDTVIPMCSGQTKIIRVWTVMDWCTGESRVGMQEILIEDSTPPVVVCPPNETVSTDPDICGTNYTLKAPVSVTDVCSDDNLIETVILVSSVPGFYQPGDVIQLDTGIHTITIRAIDDCQNTGECTYTITVVDDVSPIPICSNFSTSIGANGVIVITAVGLQFPIIENCGVESVMVSRMEDNCGIPADLIPGPSITLCCDDVGDTVMVAFKVTDINGNVNTCMFGIIVKDGLPPIAVCNDVTLSVDANGMVGLLVDAVDGGSSDNCGIVDRTINPSNFNCMNIGQTNQVTLTVTDASGNTDDCVSNVTIVDTIPPNALCRDITVTLDTQGMAMITAFDVDNWSNDNCGIDTAYINKDQFECLDLGANQVTLTVVDESGNSSTCIATVTIKELPPVAICQDVTVYLDANGVGSIVAADIDNGSTSSCGLDTMFVTPSDFVCADFGTNTVVLTVVDLSGNSATCNATVTVRDTLGPTCATQDITVQLDANGEASIMSTAIDAGSADNCADITLLVEPMDFDCSDLGDNMVELTVIDIMGNLLACPANVNIKDTISPICITNDFVVELDATGNGSITPADIDNGSTDNCTIVMMDISPNAFTCANVGDNVVTLTLTDQSGNTSQCTANVDVQDNIDPNAICMDATVYLDAGGNAQITTNDIDNNSNDNCAIQSVSVIPNAFVCADTGANAVVLTVTDVNGNISTCNATVTVLDTIAPTMICQDVTVTLDGTGMASITTNDVDNGSSDNCEVALTVFPTNFTCANVGTVQVTLTGVDLSGNIDSCIATITVLDIAAPVALCDDIVVPLDAMGNASIIAADIDGGSVDNCDDITLSIDSMDFDCGDIGLNQVILTVTDMGGNSASCIGTVTIVDDSPPVANCQDVTVFLDANGMVTATTGLLDDGSTDNCGDPNLMLSQTAFTCADIGVNTVILTATDISGNSDTCHAFVTVVDTISPICITQSTTVTLDANGMATITATDIDNGSSDNCGPVTISVDPSTFDCNSAGVNIVTLTVTDPAGNSSTCTDTVFVLDIAPTAMCQDITVQLDAGGSAIIMPSDIDNGSGSNCGGITLTLNDTSFDCSNIGPNMVTLTVDDGFGNFSTCTATVTVQDTISPICNPQDVTVYLDAGGNGSITVDDVDNGSTDNCPPVTRLISDTDFNCDDIGANTVTLTVTDPNGNSSSCDAVVTVLDTISPICLVEDITISLDGSGNAMITVNDVNAGSSDNCSPLTFGLTPTNFSCDDLGPNMVTLTAIDGSGNTSSCVVNVTVIDENNLVANCQNITINLNANGTASITPEEIDTGSGGGCTGGGIDLALNQTDFDCGDIGTNIVTLTVTDQLGNSATCTAIVTVQDITPPIITCPPNASVNCGDITDMDDLDSFPSATAVDNCPPVTITSIAVFNLDNCGAGTITRTFTATDGSGNTSTCIQILTVVNPDPFTESDITYPNAVINLFNCASTDPASIPNGSPVINLSAGSCSDPILTFSDSTITTFDNNPSTPCTEVYRTWTIIDSCQLQPGTTNGIFTFEQLITVNDFTVPTFNALNDIVVTANPGTCEADVVLIVSANDCSNITYTNDSPFANSGGANASGTYPFGTTMVTFTATDECGNVATKGFNVTVEEDVTATFFCEKIIVFLPLELQITINAQDFVTVTPGSCTDENSLLFSYTNGNPFDSLKTFNCAQVGVTTVNLYFYDLNGNLLAFCNDADLELVDTADYCGDGFMLSGDIGSEEGFAIGATEILIEEMNGVQAVTEDDGEYMVDGLSYDGQYTVRPKRDINDTEGVSTLDLVLIQKHLLGVKKLESPFKMIAADADRSGHISGIDLLEIRKLLLGIYSEFPNNESWRFVENSFTFPDPFDPWMTDFPESMFLNGLSTPFTFLNFTGIKVGDVNSSFFSNILGQGPIIEIREGTARLAITDQIISRGDVYEIPVYLNDVDEAVGMQFEIDVDAEKMEILDLQLPGESVIRRDHFSYNEQLARISWNATENVRFDDSSPLFTLKVRAVQGNVSLSNALELSHKGLSPELYIDDKDKVLTQPLHLDFGNGLGELGYALYQNRPNPFSDQTEISFMVVKETSVKIEIFDMEGRLIYHTERNYAAGRHALQLNTSIMNNPGVYYYIMSTPEFTATRKMIKTSN